MYEAASMQDRSVLMSLSFFSQAGFFKSKYKDLMNEAGEAAEPGADEAEAEPEQ